MTFADEKIEYSQDSAKQQLTLDDRLKNILTKKFKEPLLIEKKFKNKEVYRFTYLPTFAEPFMFRLEVINDLQGTIYYKRLSGEGGYDLGSIDLSSSKLLKGAEFSALLKNIRKPRKHKIYGNLTQEQINKLGGLDGSSWYLESLVNNEYLCTYVWSAERLPEVKVMLEKKNIEEDYKKISKELDPEAFIFACISLVKSAGYTMDNELGIVKPDPTKKIENNEGKK